MMTADLRSVAGGVRHRASGTTLAMSPSASAATARQAPSDPFAVDVQSVLDALYPVWGYRWVLTYRPDSKQPWQARRCEHPVDILAGETPDELVRKLREDAGEAL